MSLGATGFVIFEGSLRTVANSVCFIFFITPVVSYSSVGMRRSIYVRCSSLPPGGAVLYQKFAQCRGHWGLSYYYRK